MIITHAPEYLAASEFPPGSMGPTIKGGAYFVEHGGSECIVTSTERVAGTLESRGGTHIV